MLFIGCRSQTVDRLYAAEMDAWERMGVVSLRYAFSREGPITVPQIMWTYRKEIVELWNAEARVYVCGSGGFVKSLGEATKNIVGEVVQGILR